MHNAKTRQMQLSEREKHILQFFYDNQESCCIDDGNVLYHYSTRYDDWKPDITHYNNAFTSLETKGFIERDEPPMDCFIAITDKGISVYKAVSNG